MIKAECFTNVDAFRRCSWPTTFCIAPTIGQRVEEVGGGYSLKICQITHCEKEIAPKQLHQDFEVTSYLKIELIG